MRSRRPPSELRAKAERLAPGVADDRHVDRDPGTTPYTDQPGGAVRPDQPRGTDYPDQPEGGAHPPLSSGGPAGLPAP